MQFHETPMGNLYYNKQLPNLINQVTRLADAMENQVAANPMVYNPSDDCDILSKLYNGELRSDDLPFIPSSEYQTSLKNHENEVAKLKTTLTPEQCNDFDKCSEIMNQLLSEDMRFAFSNGFRIATQLIFAGLIVPNKEIKNDV